MVVLFVLGLILVGSAIALLAIALRPASEPTSVNRSLAVLEAMTNAPAELTKEVDRSFADRVLAPLQQRALGLGRRISGADSAERIRARLDLAGNPAGWSVDRVTAGRVLCAGLGLVIGLAVAMVLSDAFTTRLILTVAGIVLGFFGPSLYLYQLGYDRSQRLQRELPDALDLMTISVESGLGFDAAVQQVSLHTDGPLADEFARMLREMQLGMGRSEALRSLGDRTNVDDIRSFVSAMVQADAFGIPVAQVLRVQTSEMRTKRRQRAEEKAQQVPVKITIPLIFCILPALFVAVMGPAVINVLDSMF
ncbi:type II secretion system F family protein [Nocardioides sp.]|uniref:type II secretion system F family protein n=1 Tax=Nocardioides sp. TaxID=35761 RepID=UPI0026211C81|nr:type II secretion system F family protein [Nocardioides sp.]